MTLPGLLIIVSLLSLPPLELPQIDRDALVFGERYRFAIATGNAASLGVATSASTLSSNARGTRLQMPLRAYGSFEKFFEGRSAAWGLDLEGSIDASYARGQGNDASNVDISAPRAHGYYRRYLSPSLTDPCYIEGSVGMRDGVYELYDDALTSRHGYQLPWRAGVSIGIGRVYDIEPRLRLEKLQRMLMDQGIIAQAIPAETARQIMLAWWALRGELGYALRLQYTIKTLADANVIVGDVNQLSLYEFGRIFNDSALSRRREGHDSRLTVRGGYVWTNGSAIPPILEARQATFVAELSHRQIFNLRHDRELSFEPVMSLAPRSVDRLDNVLAATNPIPGVDYARVAFSVPLSLRYYYYDDLYNPRGTLGLRVRIGGAADAASTALPGSGFWQALAGVGADYTWFHTRATGYTVALGADAGRAYGSFAYVLTAQLRVELGHEQAWWVGPTEP